MKRINIFQHKVGLLFRNGNYLRVLKPGVHWVRLTDEVREYDTTQPFFAPCELNILLQDEELTELLEVIEVKDNELVFQYRDGNFHQVLEPGRYPFWKSVIKYAYQRVDFSQVEVPEELDRKMLRRRDLQLYFRLFKVEPYEAGLLLVDGEYVRKLKPGIYYFWNNERVVNLLKADLRQQQLEISGQEILTKDKAALRINFFTQYRITDVEKVLLENKDAEKLLYVLLQLALREYVGTLALDELLANKEQVRAFVMEQLADKADELGLRLINCGIRDVILPGDMKEIMNQVLVAEKKAQANTILRREETASTRSLLNTAKLMEDNPMLLRLKEMEYVEKIAEKINSISLSGGTQIVEQLRQIFLKE